MDNRLAGIESPFRGRPLSPVTLGQTMSIPGKSRWHVLTVVGTACLFVCILANAAMFLFDASTHDRRVGLAFFVLLVPLFLVCLALAFLSRPNRRVTATREDVPCPACGYNLRGLKETRCPECGTQFTIEQLVEPDARRG